MTSARFNLRLKQKYASRIGPLWVSVRVCAAFLGAFAMVYLTGSGPAQEINSSSINLISRPFFGDGPASETTCQPKTNLVFIKTHKCASSTVQNVLMRFGEFRNLTFALPVNPGMAYLGYMGKFTPDLTLQLPSVYSDHFNVLCHHTRWHRDIKKIMPLDATYMSIIREPASMFESAYEFLLLRERYNVSLETFVEDPAKYYNNHPEKLFGRNPMMFDLGLLIKNFDNEAKIDDKITELSDTFPLIMLSNYMDESLLLLRQLMCWSWNDIVVFHVNARDKQFRKKVSAEVQEKIRRWNSADAKLYAHFHKRFLEQIEQYGVEAMRDDARRLRQLTKEWYGYCVEREQFKSRIEDQRFEVFTDNVLGFQLAKAGYTNSTCVSLAMVELAYTAHLRSKLWPGV